MKPVETDILVVGGGPAGLIAAREAARRGVDVTVFEEDREIGLPCHCAGLLSLKGLDEIKVPSNGPFVQNRVRGACFYSPSGLSFKVERDEAVASVVDRVALDRFLANQAIEAGAVIRVNSKVRSLKRVNGEMIAEVEQGPSIRVKMIIDAEGVSSRLVKAIGLKPLKPECILPALQFDLESIDINPEYVELYVGEKIAPGFFAWVIPLSGDSARVGLACRGSNPYERLDRFVQSRFGGKDRFNKVSTRSGLIVTCGPIGKTFGDNLMVVGDAAGQVKPTTGGGVVMGGICASIAGEVAAEAVEKGMFTSSFLRRYEVLWRERLGREFRLTRLARRVADRLPDKTIDKVFKAVIDENLQSELSIQGDMDLQSGVILRLLRKRKILKALPSALASLIQAWRE